MYIGAYLSMEWYGAGFEQIVDNAKWQLKWHHHGYISTWEKADSVFWSDEGDPNDDAKGSPIQSKCAAGSDAPDRIVFLAIDWELDSEDEWVASLSKVVDNVKSKYPSVKLLEFMTLVRCPNNQMCNDDATYGQPGTNLVAAQQDCWVPDYQDAAIAKVAAQHAGFVGAGPKPQMMDCPSDGAHMSPAGNTQAAKDLGAYYLARP